jgi:hypothetical protein
VLDQDEGRGLCVGPYKFLLICRGRRLKLVATVLPFEIISLAGIDFEIRSYDRPISE